MERAIAVRKLLGNLEVGQPLLTNGGQMWVRVGWESVAHQQGAMPPWLLKQMGLVPICDMGGNIRMGPDSLVVVTIDGGTQIDNPIVLSYWQYSVN